MREVTVVCVKNNGHEASLEPSKVYQVPPDAQATRHELVRVIDGSGEDYLYPEDYLALSSCRKSH